MARYGLSPYYGGASTQMDDFFNQQLERFFGVNPFGGRMSSGGNGTSSSSSSLPAVNVREADGNFEIEVAAPGMSKDAFSVDVEDGVLAIKAESKSETTEGDENRDDGYHRREFSYTSFERRFHLPDNVNEEDIQASYEDGILKLKLPKLEPEEQKPQKRTIEIG